MDGKPDANVRTWVSVSYEMQETIRRIEAKGSARSANFLRLKRHFEAGLPLQPLIEDIVTALERDGYRATYDEVREYVVGFPAESGIGLLVRTVYDAAVEALVGDETAIRRPALLYENLAACDAQQDTRLQARPTAYFPDTLEFRKDMFEPEALPHCVDAELSGALEHHLPLIIVATGICDELLEYRPFGRLNSLFEIVFRAALFTRIGLPALVGVPLSKYCKQWEDKCLPESLLVSPLGSCTKAGPFGADATLFFEQKIVLCEKGLDDLSRLLERAAADMESSVSAVRRDKRLNLRQQQAMIALLGNRRIVFDAALYQEKYDTTAPTARSDLNKLTSLGLLACKTSGKKLVYNLRHDFKSALR